MAASIKSNPSQTLLVICIGLTLIYFFSDISWIIYLSFGLGLLGILSEWFARKVERAWLKLGSLLNLIMPNVLLGLVFFLFLTPIAFLAALFAKKDLLLIKKPKDSAYQLINKPYQSKDLENPW